MAGHHPYQEHREHVHAKHRVGHITKGYATGGAVHDDEAEDERLIKKEVKKSALKRARGGKIDGEMTHHRLDRRAAGGRTKKGGKTTVNVIVPHGGAPGGAPAGIGAAAPPPMPAPPPPRPPMAGPPGAPPMGPGMPPPGMPPGAPPIRARGGRIAAGHKKGSEIEPGHTAKAIPRRARGGNVPGEELKKAYDTGRANSSTGAGRPKDGPAWKEGLKNGTPISHTAGNTAGASLAAHEGVKKVRTYKTGGKIKDVSVDEKPPFSHAVEAGMGDAKANPWPHMRAGAKSGEGRLEKIGKARGAAAAP